MSEHAPTAFRQWRQRLNFTQQVAAIELGYSERRIRAYDVGEDRPPRIVRLGMIAIEKGLSPPRLIKDDAA